MSPGERFALSPASIPLSLLTERSTFASLSLSPSGQKQKQQQKQQQRRPMGSWRSPPAEATAKTESVGTSFSSQMKKPSPVQHPKRPKVLLWEWSPGAPRALPYSAARAPQPRLAQRAASADSPYPRIVSGPSNCSCRIPCPNRLRNKLCFCLPSKSQHPQCFDYRLP